jgi:S-adenosylmethionine:tRNA ribosyltransferase-isomerase
MHPKDLRIADFMYELPDERIARFPLAERDQSKLLVFRNGQISDSYYHQLPQHLPEGSLLVFNKTKVVQARLLFQKPSGGQIEIFCLEPPPLYADITSAMQQRGSVQWQCLAGGAGKWKQGALEKTVVHDSEYLQLKAEKLAQGSGVFTIAFSWSPATLTFAEVLHIAGQTPLPPYLRRQPETSDTERYQTIYAQEEGSVAAPTAGLHFTPQLMQALKEKNTGDAYLTLHVGAGTFMPVKSETMSGHTMHTEFIEVEQETILQLRRQLPGTIVTVGTTSLRTVESLYWLGLKAKLGLDPGEELQQWDAYQLPGGTTAEEALESLLEWMQKNEKPKLISRTQLLIAPGYRLRIAEGLITNFHQPGSTLLLLVAALLGEDWKKVYAHAMENDYRFLSYGDGSLLWKTES